MQECLALQDVRAVLLKLSAIAALQTMEAAADTAGKDRSIPFNTFRPAMWEALKQYDPTKRDYTAMSSLQLKGGEEVHNYLNRAKKLCENSTGERYDANSASKGYWRHDVQKGLPMKVQAKLEDTVGLDSMP